MKTQKEIENKLAEARKALGTSANEAEQDVITGAIGALRWALDKPVPPFEALKAIESELSRS